MALVLLVLLAIASITPVTSLASLRPGLGFTWFEAPLYVAQGYAAHGVAPWGMQIGWRSALFGMSGHAMFTGIFGASSV